MNKAAIAVISSAIQKACHTPFAEKILLRINAVGMIIIVYLKSEMMSDGRPLLSPSRAPDEVTDTADTTKPALIIRSAFLPISMVSALVENIEISLSGIVRQITVPISIIPAVIMRTVL